MAPSMRKPGFALTAFLVICAGAFTATKDHWWFKDRHSIIRVDGSPATGSVYTSVEGQKIIFVLEDCLLVRGGRVILPNTSGIRNFGPVVFVDSVPLAGVWIQSPKIESYQNVALEESSLRFERNGKNVQVNW